MDGWNPTGTPSSALASIGDMLGCCGVRGEYDGWGMDSEVYRPEDLGGMLEYCGVIGEYDGADMDCEVY
jgi:hypothetical protein